MDNETMVAQAIQSLTRILKNADIISTDIYVDDDWNDGARSVNVTVKYYPEKENKS